MDAKHNGGPAFPSQSEFVNDGDALAYAPDFTTVPPGGRHTMHASGMTLRDYFAAQALHAALVTARPGSDDGLDDIVKHAAVAAYKAANAMLKTRQS